MGEQPPSLEALGGWRTVLGRLAGHGDLTQDEARAAMAEILEGAATPAQIAGFIVALRMKGETVEELDGSRRRDARRRGDRRGVAGGARAARRHVRHRRRPQPHDQRVDASPRSWSRARACRCASTATAPRRRRAAPPTCSRRSASRIDLEPRGVARCVEEAGIGFCFAPRFHPAHAPRRARPPRARRADHVQLPRPAGQPGARRDARSSA